ncbi:glutaredoxin family protein [Sulfobacillus thermosulfidooxidans]|uniref:Glutaredoxin family protein n=1 Tax=Sulfobacillus thermosulfidooxidans TaxID=28034 RepID=A0A1R0IMV2_SULTH|nr:glutaredoxin family protein [Sulfobacillus thermosulfidooxidans]OLZ08180.1 hypothetical protein BFX05_05250 [Sulfobacillus thermosulfidooxidans]OLZ14960.1 hypothetical protein BFX06_05000 [Sulfobacillus thermosulfidooxidans]OLZ19681.1 hypothetical protein BFX07_03210 [Sulfobacillus thermosulfidooxidans]PSR27847.1 MAG: glutaredoxin family protein [Sulfobacillus thermosulfidooxidans]
MPSVDIYTHPGCPGGEAAEIFFKQRGIPYQIYNIADNIVAQQKMQQWGYKETPILVIGEQILRGFDPVALEEWWRHSTS